MKTQMWLNGRKLNVVIGQDGIRVLTNLTRPVKLDVKNNKLVAA